MLFVVSLPRLQLETNISYMLVDDFTPVRLGKLSRRLH